GPCCWVRRSTSSPPSPRAVHSVGYRQSSPRRHCHTPGFIGRGDLRKLGFSQSRGCVSYQLALLSTEWIRCRDREPGSRPGGKAFSQLRKSAHPYTGRTRMKHWFKRLRDGLVVLVGAFLVW